LLNTFDKALKSIIAQRISDLTKTHWKEIMWDNDFAMIKTTIDR
jgi:hypothetical protein